MTVKWLCGWDNFMKWQHKDHNIKLEHTGSPIDMQTHAGCSSTWPWQQTSLATVTVLVTVWPWPCDPWVDACRTTTIVYMCPKFGVNSSSHFPFSFRQTDRETWLNAQPTPAAVPAWVTMHSCIRLNKHMRHNTSHITRMSRQQFSFRT